ncbi:hypothetical protein CEXT_288621 [Caerostris extrusa]|uniref:Uncharacterized protein n=1 Tax=Caerostris extrusa TaxID=172846 RepID=A0AAV4QGE3_CAEEX|nr:hypothetical protein CEXT_288621 [Caerostris extrusa]
MEKVIQKFCCSPTGGFWRPFCGNGIIKSEASLSNARSRCRPLPEEGAASRQLHKIHFTLILFLTAYPLRMLGNSETLRNSEQFGWNSKFRSSFGTSRGNNSVRMKNDGTSTSVPPTAHARCPLPFPIHGIQKDDPAFYKKRVP